MRSPQALRPVHVAIAGRELAIAWEDGHESYFAFDWLRRNCPCAGCRARASASAGGALRVVTGPSIGEVGIVRLSPVGTYAVQIEWSDGHDTGLYAYEALRRECPCPECVGG